MQHPLAFTLGMPPKGAKRGSTAVAGGHRRTPIKAEPKEEAVPRCGAV